MNNREIVVKGIGKVSAVPDLIVINMNFKVIEPDYEKAIRRGTELLDALRNAIVSVGHDDSGWHSG